jgi:site-specific DNA recombinase
VKKLVSESFSTGSGKDLALDQLADLQDQIRALELRMTSINEETITIKKESVDESELARAVTSFDPVWETLSLREQSRIMRLLIERDGIDKVVLTEYTILYDPNFGEPEKIKGLAKRLSSFFLA